MGVLARGYPSRLSGGPGMAVCVVEGVWAAFRGGVAVCGLGGLEAGVQGVEKVKQGGLGCGTQGCPTEVRAEMRMRASGACEPDEAWQGCGVNRGVHARAYQLEVAARHPLPPPMRSPQYYTNKRKQLHKHTTTWPHCTCEPDEYGERGEQRLNRESSAARNGGGAAGGRAEWGWGGVSVS